MAHSGSHSLSEAMGGIPWLHPQPPLEVTDDCLLIVLLRNPVDVYRSWVRRGHSIGNLFREHWENLYILAEQYKSLWVYIDQPCCEEQLIAVSERTGIKIEFPLPKLNVFGCGRTDTLTGVEENEMMTEQEFIEWHQRIKPLCL